MFALGKSHCCFVMKQTVCSQALDPAREGERLVQYRVCDIKGRYNSIVRGHAETCSRTSDLVTVASTHTVSCYTCDETYQALSSLFSRDQEPGHKVRRYKKPLVQRGKGEGQSWSDPLPPVTILSIPRKNLKGYPSFANIYHNNIYTKVTHRISKDLGQYIFVVGDLLVFSWNYKLQQCQPTSSQCSLYVVAVVNLQTAGSLNYY